jgi:hypothetical protein
LVDGMNRGGYETNIMIWTGWGTGMVVGMGTKIICYGRDQGQFDKKPESDTDHLSITNRYVVCGVGLNYDYVIVQVGND